MEKEYRNG